MDLDTPEVKNGESIADLRKMVLGMASYRPSDIVPGKYVALDCEMVGVGLEGSESSLARVSIVNFRGAIVLDTFVRQRERVVDYRTQWSGVRRADLGKEAISFDEIQKTVADLIKGRILVGHAVYNDLKVLLLSHPSLELRDTQSLAYKHKLVKSRRPALRFLVRQELGIAIQEGEHDSVTDARATMALFRLHKKQWESKFKLPPTPMKTKSKCNSTSTSLDTACSPKVASPAGSSKIHKRTRSGSLSGRSPQGPSPSLECSDTSFQASNLGLDGRRSKRPKTTDDRGRKHVSSGLSTVVRRAGGMKEVVGKSRKKPANTSKPKEEWWSTLGCRSSGSKGSDQTMYKAQDLGEGC